MLMKKRRNWFLSPSTKPTTGTSLSTETESITGSREASLGKSSKSSYEAISSEALSGEVSDSTRELDSTFDDSSAMGREFLQTSPHSQSHHIVRSNPYCTVPRSYSLLKQSQDIVNGNHQHLSHGHLEPPNKTSTPQHQPHPAGSGVNGGHSRSQHPWDDSSTSGSPTPSSGHQHTSQESHDLGHNSLVRCFIVERVYGTDEPT
jgi:hypothetical protein